MISVAFVATIHASFASDQVVLVDHALVIPPQNSPLNPCMVHCCMHWCANRQEHQDMKGHLSGNTVMPMAIINPPAVQEMNANEN